jgi:hypothetical protein
VYYCVHRSIFKTKTLVQSLYSDDLLIFKEFKEPTIPFKCIMAFISIPCKVQVHMNSFTSSQLCKNKQEGHDGPEVAHLYKGTGAGPV